MPKIVFIGAGSLGFTRKLVRDLLTFPRLAGAEFALVDIHRERLEFARLACEKIVRMSGKPARVTATTDRRRALDGADAILVTILCGSTTVWQHDILVPKKYGVDVCVGDTRGPSGIFRALRTIPEMLAICRDAESRCPGAILLNYTNPMAMLCHAMQRVHPKVLATGLCHSVQGTARMLARWLGVPGDELEYLCAGINHMAWYLRLGHKGKDLYPRLRRIVETNRKVYDEEPVRNEMFLALDCYVTESSGHNSEYNAWFRKRPDLIRKYCTRGTGWNPGRHAYILGEYRKTEKTWKKKVREWLSSDAPISLARGREYAAPIIDAFLGGRPFKFNGNVPNEGFVTNLPEGACVEIPVAVSKGRLTPRRVGALPASVAMLTNLSAQIEMLAVEGALAENPRLIYQAVAHDPLTASVLSLAEIRKMTEEMFRKNRRFLK